jgi:hypothetical protein
MYDAQQMYNIPIIFHDSLSIYYVFFVPFVAISSILIQSTFDLQFLAPFLFIETNKIHGLG